MYTHSLNPQQYLNCVVADLFQAPSEPTCFMTFDEGQPCLMPPAFTQYAPSWNSTQYTSIAEPKFVRLSSLNLGCMIFRFPVLKLLYRMRVSKGRTSLECLRKDCLTVFHSVSSASSTSKPHMYFSFVLN